MQGFERLGRAGGATLRVSADLYGTLAIPTHLTPEDPRMRMCRPVGVRDCSFWAVPLRETLGFGDLPATGHWIFRTVTTPVCDAGYLAYWTMTRMDMPHNRVASKLLRDDLYGLVLLVGRIGPPALLLPSFS